LQGVAVSIRERAIINVAKGRNIENDQLHTFFYLAKECEKCLKTDSRIVTLHRITLKNMQELLLGKAGSGTEETVEEIGI